DIDASSLTWKPIGGNRVKYAGHFDGNHQKITINLPGTAAYSGLFGYLAAGGMIENLTVAGTVSGGNNTGGVVGYLNGATISGCTNMTAVNGVQYAGGITGNSTGAANILDCINTGTITGSGHTVGGIVGNGALTGLIENCSNSGMISATNNAGGIVGNAYAAATIRKCFNSGSVTGTSTDTTPSAAANSAGGIAGFVYAAATIDQCYNSGAIGGGVTNSGGIAGYLNDANSKVTNSYNVGSVTNSSTSANAAVGGIVGYLKNTGGFVQNCYNTGTLSLTASASNYLAGVIGYAGVTTHVSNNYYLNTTATQATGKTTSTDANAQAKTSSGMRDASFVTALGSFYQLGPVYPALSWEKVVVTDEDVDINDGSPVEIGSAQDTINIVLGNALVTAIGAANDVSLQLTTSNGEFTFDTEATDEIMAAAESNDIVFRALQLTESDDPVIQALIDDDALVFDFSLSAGGNPIFTEGSSSGMVSIRIPYELGSGDPDNIKVYLVDGGVKTPVSATYDNGYIIFSVEHFSIYSIEYQGLKIWAEFDGANTHFNGSDQVTVKIYARGDEAVAYGSYQADVDFNSAHLTFNSSASAMEAGTSYMNLSSPGKVQIGYSSSESISQNLNAGCTLLATLVFNVQPVATDGSTGSIGISNADFEVGGNAAQDANIGADLGYTLHNIRLTFQAGTGTTLTTTYAYVKYHEAGLYTDATYTTSINVPVPVAVSGYRLAADSELSPLWKDASGTGYTSADIAAGTFTAGATFTAQASRRGSSGSGGNTSKKDVEEDVEEDIIEEDVQEDDSSPVKSFTDIQENDWYYAAIKFVTDRGLFTGISSTTFEPQTTMSRDMLVTVLYRMEGEPVVGNDASNLSDVNAGSWYANAVAWAMANEIITGYDSGKFGPKDPVTREQLLAILYRYSSFKGYDISVSSDLTAFTDSGKIKDYALIPFKWGTGNGLIDGKGAGILDPAGNATRAEVATILMRFINMIQ
ncbi:MAG: S-layer homology domain-containing protein, partial [Dehalobacterium sp.]